MYHIYKLYSDSDDELVYYGRTVLPLHTRFYHHLHHTNICTSKRLFQKYGGDVKIILLEDVEDEATAIERERFYIEHYPCVNRCLPGRSQEQWYIDNKEYRRDYLKAYDLKRKDSRKEKMVCECGREVSKRHRNEHFQTKTHQSYLQSLQ